jgi:pilus assembly protein CpaE
MSELPDRKGRIRVLIVDDIAEVRQTLKEHVASDPDLCVVGEASNGIEAVLQFRLLAPDVVSMNINMPDMDGITATECLTERPGGARVVIVSVVASEPDHYHRASCAGAIACLDKPVDRAEYVRALKAAASEQPRRTQSGAR